MTSRRWILKKGGSAQRYAVNLKQWGTRYEKAEKRKIKGRVRQLWRKIVDLPWVSLNFVVKKGIDTPGKDSHSKLVTSDLQAEGTITIKVEEREEAFDKIKQALIDALYDAFQLNDGLLEHITNKLELGIEDVGLSAEYGSAEVSTATFKGNYKFVSELEENLDGELE